MNVQIQNILNENGTKTSKIQKLLRLGLTRREVADLVTNGNYGFVQNVYKKMMQATAEQAAQNAQAIAPSLQYTFTRNFGVEIEAYNCEMGKVAAELRNAGIRVEVEGYNHTDHRDHWKLVRDSSLHGNNTFELVSPILKGENGLDELEKVCWVLEMLNVKVNESCGLHVHMNASDFTIDTWRNLVISYKRMEGIIDGFMPSSRRSNNYCRRLAPISEERIKNARNIAELRSVFNNYRYYKVNLEAYARHSTVEFRQHAGSTNFTKISTWVHFLDKMITFAKSNVVGTNISLDTVPFISEREKLYLKLRTRKFSA